MRLDVVQCRLYLYIYHIVQLTEQRIVGVQGSLSFSLFLSFTNPQRYYHTFFIFCFSYFPFRILPHVCFLYFMWMNVCQIYVKQTLLLRISPLFLIFPIFTIQTYSFIALPLLTSCIWNHKAWNIDGWMDGWLDSDDVRVQGRETDGDNI